MSPEAAHLASARNVPQSHRAAAVAEDDDKLVIDKYQFTWTRADVGRIQFQIQKDEKATKAALRFGLDSISMTLEEAETLGATLARTDEFAEKLKGTKSQSERVKTCTIHVDFMTTEIGDFRVQIAPEKWMRNFASLHSAEAKGLAGAMKTAVKAGAIVDQKIKL